MFTVQDSCGQRCRLLEYCVTVLHVQSVRGMLENPTEAVNESSYFDCIDSVMENSKVGHILLTLYCFYFSPLFVSQLIRRFDVELHHFFPFPFCLLLGPWWVHGWHFSQCQELQPARVRWFSQCWFQSTVWSDRSSCTGNILHWGRLILLWFVTTYK